MRPATLFAAMVIIMAGLVFWWTSGPAPQEAVDEQECSSCDNRKKDLGKLREALSDEDSAAQD